MLSIILLRLATYLFILFPLANNGRQSDGSYVLRNNVQVGTGSIAPTPTTYNLIVFQGDSNSAGRGLNVSASALELSSRSMVQILNNDNLTFENLQVGVNNNLQQNLPGGEHGWEIGLANAVSGSTFPPTPCYLVKCGGSGSTIAEWLQGGSPAYNTYGWAKLIERMDAAVNYLNAQGITFKITVWQTIGLNDYNQGVTTSQYKTRMEQFRADFRARYGSNIRFCLCDYFDGHPFNTTINQIVNEDPTGTSRIVDVTGATYRDGAHYDYNGYKFIAARLVSASLAP